MGTTNQSQFEDVQPPWSGTIPEQKYTKRAPARHNDISGIYTHC